jgi:hypothetical protein
MREGVVVWSGFVIALLASIQAASAQEGTWTCPTLVRFSMTQLGTTCAALRPGTACLGQLALSEVALRDAAANTRYSQRGDQVDLEAVAAIQTGPIDLEHKHWGLNTMRVAVAGADAATGLVYVQLGGVEIENGVTPTDPFSPMQRFYFRTGVGGVPCEEDAPALLVVQSDSETPVEMVVFDQRLEVQGTLVLRTQPDGDALGDHIELMVLSGLVEVNADAPDGTLVAPGYGVTLQLAPELVSLGVQGDADEKRVQGTWSAPVSLAPEVWNPLETLTLIPEGVLFERIVLPQVIVYSGLGVEESVLYFSDSAPLTLARTACADGKLPEDVCTYLDIGP